MTLEEAFTNKKLKLVYLKVFGCVAYCHIPSRIKNKLDSKSFFILFIGCDENSCLYYSYNHIIKKIIRS